MQFAPPLDTPLQVRVGVDIIAVEGRGDGELRVTLQEGALPLAELAVCDLTCAAELELWQSSIVELPVEEPLRRGRADVRMRVHCVSFNEDNRSWEPILAPWCFVLQWRCNDDEMMAPDGVHRIELVADESLEVDVTHAALASALRCLTVVARAEDSEAAATGLQTCALINNTELPVNLLSSSGNFDEQPFTPLGRSRWRRGRSRVRAATLPVHRDERRRLDAQRGGGGHDQLPRARLRRAGGERGARARAAPPRRAGRLNGRQRQGRAPRGDQAEGGAPPCAAHRVAC